MRRVVLVATFLSWAIAACGDSPAAGQPTARSTAVPSTAVSPTIAPSEHVIATNFPGAEACTTNTVFAGAAGGGSGGADQIWVAPVRGGSASRLIQLALPDLRGSSPNDSPPTISPLKAAGDWLTFTEEQQQGSSLVMAYWNVVVVHVPDRRLTIVASGSGAALNELPSPSISIAGVVVWDQLGPAGKVLDTRNMVTSESRTLPLAVGAYPISPRIDGSLIAFANNATDPKRSTENWVSRGGRLMLYDLATGQVRALSSTDDARWLQFSQNRVLWSATVADPLGRSSSAFDIRWSSTDGSDTEVLAAVGTNGVISSKDAVWFDYEAQVTYAHSFETGNTYLVHVHGLGFQPNLPSPFTTLCGDQLYYLDATTGRELRSVALP